MKVGVLFSSGLDSTYLVYKNLKEGNTVQPIYVDVLNRYVTKLEKNRVDLLYKEFHKEFKDQIKQPINPFIIKNIYLKDNKNIIHPQQPIWVFILLYLQEIGVDEFQIGLVNSDDILLQTYNIELYQSYQPFHNTKLKPLTFPIKDSSKIEIANKLPGKYLNYVISCLFPNRILEDENREVMQYEACGKCNSCKEVIDSNFYGLPSLPKNFYAGYYHLFGPNNSVQIINKKLI